MSICARYLGRSWWKILKGPPDLALFGRLLDFLANLHGETANESKKEREWVEQFRYRALYDRTIYPNPGTTFTWGHHYLLTSLSITTTFPRPRCVFLDTKYSLAAEQSSQGSHGIVWGRATTSLKPIQKPAGNGAHIAAHNELNCRKSWTGYVRYP